MQLIVTVTIWKQMFLQKRFKEKTGVTLNEIKFSLND